MATTTTEKETLKIEVSKHESFDNTLETHLTTTVELSGVINGLFRPVFSDYEGCNVQIINNKFAVSLFFKDKGTAEDGKFKSVTSVIGTLNKKSSSVMDRIAKINLVNSARNIALTDETKEMLTEFFDVRPGTQPNWAQVCSEVTEATYNGQYIYMKVTGLSLNKLIKKIYGSKIAVEGGKDHYCDYNVQAIKPIGGIGDSVNYLIFVVRLDNDEVMRLCSSIGIMATQGQISMVR